LNWYINTKDERKKLNIKFALKIFYVKVHRIVLKRQNWQILFNLYTSSHHKILTNRQLNPMVNACKSLSKFISSQISYPISSRSPNQSPPKPLGKRFGRRWEEKGNPGLEVTMDQDLIWSGSNYGSRLNAVWK